MKTSLLCLLVIGIVFMSGCTPAEVPSPTEILSSEPESTVLLKNESSPPLQQEVTKTTVQAPAENNQPEEKLTFEQTVWKKRINAAMAPSYCPPVTKVEYPSSYYQGPLIDSHYHLPSLPDSLPGEEEGEAEMYREYYGHNYVYEDNQEEGEDDGEEDEEPNLGLDLKISEIACTLQHEGTTRNFAFFPIYEEIYPHALEIAKRTEEQYPNLFTPFTDRPLLPEDPNTRPKALSETLAAYPGLFQGYGEISLYVLYDPREVGAGSYFPPDSPLFTEIYSVLKKHKMMVYFHPGEDMRGNFERVLKQHPDINFIVHGDQIKDDIDYLMGKYPNIYFTINNFYAYQDLFFDYQDGTPKTKESFFAALKNYEPLIQEDLKTWESLIEAHPDQVMWGLDRDEAVLWNFDRDVGLKLVDYGRAFIGRLDPAVQEKFAYKNAERLIEMSGEDE